MKYIFLKITTNVPAPTFQATSPEILDALFKTVKALKPTAVVRYDAQLPGGGRYSFSLDRLAAGHEEIKWIVLKWLAENGWELVNAYPVPNGAVPTPEVLFFRRAID